MAGIIDTQEGFKIAEHRVTGVTRDTAQVGCTKVTRADVEKLLKNMDAASVKKNFEIQIEGGSDPDYTRLNIQHSGTGWLSASASEHDGYYKPGGFGTFKSVSMCLNRAQAEKVVKVLADQLRYSLSAQKYIIEYREDFTRVWKRSSNAFASKEFSSIEEASRVAAENQRGMGGSYEYRAVPA